MTLRRIAFLYSVLLMLILALILLGYRQFVVLPKIEQGLTAFQERELSTLKLVLDKEISFLKTINYDYAVWDDTYSFVQKFDQTYVDSNFLDDLYISLKIDGAFIYDLKFSTVFGKGFDFSGNKPIELPEFNLLRTPDNQKLFPPMQSSEGVPQNSGFLSTGEGPVLFSATQVRHSDKSGEPVGVFVLVRKIRPSLMQSLSQMSQLKLSFKEIKNADKMKKTKVLKGSLQGEGFANKRQRVITDTHDNPLILLDIVHKQVGIPVLFDRPTLLTLLLLTSIPLTILLFVNIYLVEPVSRSTLIINKMVETNQLTPLTQHSKITEISDLIKYFNQLIHTIKEQRVNLEKLTLSDGLTTIANRRAFDIFLDEGWSGMQRNKRPIAILMCDIDFFKSYNDNFGHQAGDVTLKRIAQALDQRISRASDLVARYGGEEFVIVLKDTSIESMNQIIEIALDTIRGLKILHPRSSVAKMVTISIGAAIFTDFSKIPTKHNKNDLVKAADNALYRAKNNGRNRAESQVIG